MTTLTWPSDRTQSKWKETPLFVTDYWSKENLIPPLPHTCFVHEGKTCFKRISNSLRDLTIPPQTKLRLLWTLQQPLSFQERPNNQQFFDEVKCAVFVTSESFVCWPINAMRMTAGRINFGPRLRPLKMRIGRRSKVWLATMERNFCRRKTNAFLKRPWKLTVWRRATENYGFVTVGGEFMPSCTV